MTETQRALGPGVVELIPPLEAQAQWGAGGVIVEKASRSWTQTKNMRVFLD